MKIIQQPALILRAKTSDLVTFDQVSFDQVTTVLTGLLPQIINR